MKYLFLILPLFLFSCGTTRKNQHSQQITAKLTSETATTATTGHIQDSSGAKSLDSTGVKKVSETATESLTVKFRDSAKLTPEKISSIINMIRQTFSFPAIMEDPYTGEATGLPEETDFSDIGEITYTETKSKTGSDSTRKQTTESSSVKTIDTTATTATAKTAAETKSVVKDKAKEIKGVPAWKWALTCIVLVAVAFIINWLRRWWNNLGPSQ